MIDKHEKAKKIESTVAPTNNHTVALIDFSINEVVWCKLKGSNHWPARIVAIEPKKIEVFWFNDYRVSKVFRSQLFKFEANFKTFGKKCEKDIKLGTATKEALIYLASKQSK